MNRVKKNLVRYFFSGASIIFLFSFVILSSAVFADTCPGSPLSAVTSDSACSTGCDNASYSCYYYDASYTDSKCCCTHETGSACSGTESPYQSCIDSGGGAACASRAGAPSPTVHGGTGSGGTPQLFSNETANPLPTYIIPDLVGTVIRAVLGLLGVIALIIFIYGGILWMTALGEESKVKKGLDTMVWAGVGMIIIFGSYAAVQFILSKLLSG